MSGLKESIKSEVTSPIVIRPTSKVKNDSEDDEANDGQHLDGSFHQNFSRWN